MSTTQWVLDPAHSELGFKIKHLMISHVHGSFKNFQIEMQTNGDDLTTADITVTAEIGSIETNNKQRDAHLLASDFFEAEKYPELKFQSSRIEQIDSETLAVFGNLTIKGITKPVQLNVEYSGVTKDPWGGERAGFMTTGKINRSEFGLTFNAVLETGGVALSEEVKIVGEVQLVKKANSIAA